MVQLKNLIKIYRTKEGVDTCALDNVDLTFGDSGMTFILGRSGSGKTTLLNLLGGLDSPTEGEIIFDGRSSREFTQADYDGWRNECVGFVFQDYNLISDLTVGQNVALALELRGSKADKETVNEVLKEVELVDKTGETLYNRRVNELSGGQRQRVAIARALIKQPKLILADEPTGALDSKTGKQIYELLKQLSENRLVIIVSHSEEYAKAFGDRVIEMSDGKVIADSEIKIAVNGEAKEHKRGGRLPVSRMFLLGLKGLKHKTGRLIVTMILSVVCFLVLGFCITVYTVNNDSVHLNTMKSKGWSLFFLESAYKPDVWNTARIDFDDEQRKILDEYGKYLSVGNIRIEYTWEGDGHNPSNNDTAFGYYYDYKNPRSTENYRAMLLQEIDKAVLINEDINLADFGYVPDSRFKDAALCRAPQNENEIALTDFHFAAFKEYGYRGHDGKKREITVPDDLIGLRFGKYVICGVFSTDADLDYMEAHRKEYDAAERNDYIYRLGASIGWYSAADYAIVYRSSSDIETSRIGSSVLLKFDGNVAPIKKLINRLSKNSYIEEAGEERPRLAVVNSPVTAFKLDETVLMIVCGIALLAVGPLAVFGILMFMTFLSVNIERRRRQLGIMRALGATKRDVVGVCLAESTIIAAIDFAASVIALCLTCLGLNLFMHITMLIPGILPILAMFGISFLTAGLGTIIPVVRLAGKKPVEIIRTA